MNIAYIRKTDKAVKEVAARFKAGLKTRGIDFVGERAIEDGFLIHFFKGAWTEKITKNDHMLIGLVPSVALLQKKDGKTIVGVPNPQLLAGSPHLAEFAPAIEEMDRELRGLVNEAADVGEPTLQKIRLYATATCQYCRMEKDYFATHNVAYDLVMVDEDRAAAEEMIRKTGQRAVPVTEFEFDDGGSEIVVGFDRPRLDMLLKIGK